MSGAGEHRRLQRGNVQAAARTTGVPMEGTRSGFLAGARDMLPLLSGAVPFGMLVGVAAVGAGVTAVQATVMSVLLFAGASQLAAIDLLVRDAPVAVVVFTVLVVNVRMTMYSASIAPHFRQFAPRWRWPFVYVLTDYTYALSIIEFDESSPDYNRRYYLGAAVPLWIAYVGATAAGAALGARVPAAWGLDFAIPLVFVALVVPTVENRATLLAAVAAGIVAVAGAGLPFNLGLVVAAVAGVAAGLAEDWRTGR